MTDHRSGSAATHRSGTAVTTPPRARRAWLLLVVAAAFGAVLAAPYLGLDSGDSRLDVTGRPHYYLLVAHIFTALVALVLGPFQFIPAIRARRRAHRAIGRCYLLAGVLPSALTAVPVALLSGRLVSQIGLTIPAVLWLVTGWLAVRAARRRDFARHRRWMMRNYALTFLAVTSRVLVPLLLLAQVPFGGAGAGSIGDDVRSVIPIGQALGWIVNLAVVELLIRRPRSRRARDAATERPESEETPVRS
ncbi:DUF2306 domain-containing protein [Bailinhaonella thermotolerans]|uniref:DUF2306 domain-containing protein n=1 Tax=Bailinhaonella thermotolerans TaxID=1070861 RepID=A0A3A4B5E6_9ACTN|nr:DUF2306 domain-containing protein [Bailinhaonella thermotolerans]RJL32632.1 DUF2306 domain-containing protein [Bailinhaonella thermotolerans]